MHEPCVDFSGRVCAFCNCGAKSLLGQGDLTTYEATAGFNPFKKQLVRYVSSLFEKRSKEGCVIPSEVVSAHSDATVRWVVLTALTKVLRVLQAQILRGRRATERREESQVSARVGAEPPDLATSPRTQVRQVSRLRPPLALLHSP